MSNDSTPLVVGRAYPCPDSMSQARRLSVQIPADILQRLTRLQETVDGLSEWMGKMDERIRRLEVIEKHERSCGDAK